MIVIELRKAAQDKAFELLETAKELGHQKKAVLCELEDVLYECFDSSEDELDDEEMKFRSRRSYRSGMRKHKDEDYDEYDDKRRGVQMQYTRRMA